MPPPASDNAAPSLIQRSMVLFVNFMLVILAYYQVKSASRSLLLEYGGAASFPYVWVGSALVLLLFIGAYNRLVERHSRGRIVVASLLSFAALLCLFHWRLQHGGLTTVIVFYIFVDLFSVVLVEQFWSLANSVTRLEEGRKSYWFIASGGLVGGIAGGLVANALLRLTPMATVDLLLSCAVLLLVTAAMNFVMHQRDAYRDRPDDARVSLSGEGLRAVIGNRYLLLIALVVLLSQLAEPVVEFQFLRAIDAAYSDIDARTAYIAGFFSVMGVVSIGVNVLITPFVHRYLGAIAGMAVQPLCLATVTTAFAAQPGLAMAAAMKVADRGLSYSINRASKEILFIPVDPVLTYQAKAWIDMLGYRTFKVLGSGMIVTVTALAPAAQSHLYLAWLTLAICATWIIAVAFLGREQHRLLQQPTAAVAA